MFPGITFLFRGREQIIFGIIIDHGFCQDLIFRITLGGGKLFLHKSSYLIHV